MIHIVIHSSLNQTTKYSSVLTDEYTYETDENSEEYNTDKYNNLYSYIPRNTSERPRRRPEGGGGSKLKFFHRICSMSQFHTQAIFLFTNMLTNKW
jgi:hypothetical protein